MNARKVMKKVGEDLNPIKRGEKKTQAMVRGYCMTMVAFLFMAIAGLILSEDRLAGFAMLTFTLLMEALFGAYSFLSLRIRCLEEAAEKVPARR